VLTREFLKLPLYLPVAYLLAASVAPRLPRLGKRSPLRHRNRLRGSQKNRRHPRLAWRSLLRTAFLPGLLRRVPVELTHMRRTERRRASEYQSGNEAVVNGPIAHVAIPEARATPRSHGRQANAFGAQLAGGPSESGPRCCAGRLWGGLFFAGRPPRLAASHRISE
jgi:hypothetical protein